MTYRKIEYEKESYLEKFLLDLGFKKTTNDAVIKLINALKDKMEIVETILNKVTKENVDEGRWYYLEKSGELQINKALQDFETFYSDNKYYLRKDTDIYDSMILKWVKLKERISMTGDFYDSETYDIFRNIENAMTDIAEKFEHAKIWDLSNFHKNLE